MTKSKITETIKSKLHPRNKNRKRYDFDLLVKACPSLSAFVQKNHYGDLSIDFFDPEAVKMLNKALLKQFYNITYWDIPPHYLCPPIPGRADYIHHIADLLGEMNQGQIPTGKNITCLDVGVGANCIYPIIGTREYDWSFVGTEIDPVAINSANKIIELNANLKSNITIRLQSQPNHIFKHIIHENEKFDITLCNPPFHTSLKESHSGTLRKLSNLTKTKVSQPSLNFSGQSNELWCNGGELQFIKNMITESKQFSQSCLWFSTLVSKAAHLVKINELLKSVSATNIKTLPMGQGNKTSRIVAWTFLSEKEQERWVSKRWIS